ncbi:hypothetical protein [Rhizobium sp. NPDC090279]|uniref:hypothetical protein n=1 Tax=Rhizobium sp. NPDC090279 TaxID=3364499 RepID=UPI00383A20EC
MPNVTIFIPADRMPPDEALADLTEQCTELCTGILRAALVNVHVTYVAVRHGRGHLVFAEIQYRLEPFRTPAVMDRFTEGLDDAIRRIIDLTARIRCFGYAASSIHARN